VRERLEVGGAELLAQPDAPFEQRRRRFELPLRVLSDGDRVVGGHDVPEIALVLGLPQGGAMQLQRVVPAA